MKGKWGPGKITAVVLGSIGAGIVLLGSFYVGVAQLKRDIMVLGSGSLETQAWRQREKTEDSYQGFEDWLRDHEGRTYDYDEDGKAEETPYFPEYPGEYGWEDGEYYEFHDAIREDLSYQVAFENYSGQFGENIQVEVNYPVISGRDPSELSVINNALQKELEEVKEYVESVSGWLSEEENFSFEAESYVTYMDESLLSVAYVEYGYLDGETYESYVITANIDMENGMALTNTQILDIDDAFSIDFRNRCEEQNGEIDTLSMFSDQDITNLLNNDSSLIIVYTPLGMEVGFNYYYGWVTVTYHDYQKFQNHF